MARPPGHSAGYDARREEIIDKAASLFAQHGYAATGTAQLCEAVGLGKGALYHYIGSKENLLVEIQARVIGPLLVQAREIERLDAPALVRVRLLSETLLTTVFARLDHIWVYEHDYRHVGGDNRKKILRQRREFEKLLRGLLEQAIEDGALRTIDPQLAVLQFLNLHNHTYQWAHRAPKGWTPARLSRDYCATLFTGLATEGVDLDAIERGALEMQAARGEPKTA